MSTSLSGDDDGRMMHDDVSSVQQQLTTTTFVFKSKTKQGDKESLYTGMMNFLLCVVVLLTVLAISTGDDIALDHQACLSLGFNSAEAMSCSVCETLLKVTGEKQIHEDCLQCCTSSANEIYELAVLEVDKKAAKRYVHMADIMERAEAINLVLRHRRGSPPTLLM